MADIRTSDTGMTFIAAVKKLDLTDPMTKKPLTAQQVITVLQEDVVLAVTRPGSWEGSLMHTLLTRHGFLNP